MSQSVYILGLSCFYHDSAAVLLKDGEIVAAAQEERFSRIKHDEAFPHGAIAYCLQSSGISIGDIDHVAFYDKPFLKFERILETYLSYAPRGLRSYLLAIPLWIKQKLWIEYLVRKELNYEGSLLFTEHHQSHAASAFFPSPYGESAILTLDGVGEWSTTSWGVGKENQIELKQELHFPHSLGLLYSAITYYTGFRVNSGEYKVMGLAPYGEPKYVDVFYDHLIDIKDDGSFRLNMKYFNYPAGLTMTNKSFNNLFGGPPRKPEGKLTQKEMDIAASLQKVTEEIVLKIVNHIHQSTGQKNLCLAGGVALNCVANGRILREGPFDSVWIQPAAGDAGGALGAALSVWHQYLGRARRHDDVNDLQMGSYLGPSYTNEEIREYLDSQNRPYRILEDNELYSFVSSLISKENVIGWFQGRMEFGPRALGNRSILGDPRSPHMQKVLNLKIKFRESFRPFAPSILEDHAFEFFDLKHPSPYMLIVSDVSAEKRRTVDEREQKLWGIDQLNVVRSTVPAVTHVDYSARIQTVGKKTNPRYHALLTSFYEQTGCPLLVNTSFNVRGEPIVCTLEDAYTCFMRTDMDYLILGNFVLAKNDQPAFEERVNWRKEYELD